MELAVDVVLPLVPALVPGLRRTALHGLLAANLVGLVPLAFYASAWFSVQATLWPRVAEDAGDAEAGPTP